MCTDKTHKVAHVGPVPPSAAFRAACAQFGHEVLRAAALPPGMFRASTPAATGYPRIYGYPRIDFETRMPGLIGDEIAQGLMYLEEKPKPSETQLCLIMVALLTDRRRS